MSWWSDFWTWAENSQLGSNVVGGLIVAIIVAVVGIVVTLARSNLRAKVWGGVGRIFKRLGTIRLTTTDRIEKEYERGVDEGWAGHEREVAEQEAKPKPLGVTINYGADPRDQMPANPKLPAPAPRWKLDRVNESNTAIILRNVVDRSVALEVRLESDHWSFFDGAHWPDLSGIAEGVFNGEIRNVDRGTTTAILFEVSWYDESGAAMHDGVWLELRPFGWTPF